MRAFVAVSTMLVVCLSLSIYGCVVPPYYFRPADPLHTGFAKDIRGYFLNHGELTHRVIDSLARKLIHESYGQLHINSVILRTIRDETYGWTCSYQQALNGIPVYSSEIGLNLSGDGTVWSSGADIFPDINCPTSPQIAATTAREIVIRDFADHKFEIREEPGLVILPERRDTVVFHLAWRIWISSERESFVYYVSAADGKVLWKASMMRQ